MINWTGFNTNMTNFLSGQSSQNIQETAEFYSNQYDIAMSTASTMLGNMVIGGTNKPALKSSIESAFTMQLESPVSLGILPYTIMATGFITYWTTATFDPAIPHPPTVMPSTGIQLLFPGIPSPLDVQLQSAFLIGMSMPDKSAAASTISSMLVVAFTTHLMTISGIYNGLIPNPVIPPVPPLIPAPPIPWLGII